MSIADHYCPPNHLLSMSVYPTAYLLISLTKWLSLSIHSPRAYFAAYIAPLGCHAVSIPMCKHIVPSATSNKSFAIAKMKTLCERMLHFPSCLHGLSVALAVCCMKRKNILRKI